MIRALWLLAALVSINVAFVGAGVAVTSGPPRLWSVLLFANSIVLGATAFIYCLSKANP